jgi:hypothetical protein
MYVSRAAGRLGYDVDEPGWEARLTAFAHRWGGFDAQALLRALQRADGDEWYFAVELLLASDFSIAVDEAAARLQSPDRLARWYCALYLGKLGDRRGLPILNEMLVDAVPNATEYFARHGVDWRLEDARYSAATFIGELGEHSSSPFVRRALMEMLSIERNSPPPSRDQREQVLNKTLLDYIRTYEDKLIYSLGRLRAFGALTGVMIPDNRLGVWCVHLLLGSLHGQYDISGIASFEENAALVHRVNEMLQEIFGLDAVEQKQAVRDYDQTKFFMLSMLSERATAELRSRDS